MPRPAAFVVVILLVVANLFLWRWLYEGYLVRPGSPGKALAQTASPPRVKSPDHLLGFYVGNATIPREEILRGGPPKDGIPAILQPRFVRAGRAGFMKRDDLVLGIAGEETQRAYPLRIVVWHEVVNDTVDGVPVAVTYCPLCGTCMVFDRRVNGEELTFGVSGLLYNSDVLMYDHQSESLWSQLKMASVAGDRAGESLTWLPAEQMTWAAWKAKYPGTEVLSTNTGYGRDYGGTAYAGYATSDNIMFPVSFTRIELKKKAWVAGVLIDGVAKAYPIAELEKMRPRQHLEDEVNGFPLVVTYDARAKYATFSGADGSRIPHVTAYWFAWQAFYPGTEIYVPKRGR